MIENILLGLLGDPRYEFRIGFFENCWTLATGEGDSYEIIAQHEDWDEFIKLLQEISDYMEGVEDE